MLHFGVRSRPEQIDVGVVHGVVRLTRWPRGHYGGCALREHKPCYDGRSSPVVFGAVELATRPECYTDGHDKPCESGAVGSMTPTDDKDRLVWRLDRLREQSEYLREYLQRQASQEAIKPLAQRMYEDTELTVRAVGNWPEDWPMPSEADLALADVLDDLPNVLPLPPYYDRIEVAAIASVNSSGTAVLDLRIMEGESAAGTQHEAFARDVLDERHRIVEAFVKPDNVRAELGRRLADPEVLRVFDNAARLYQDWKGGSPVRDLAAQAMRALIEKVRGEISARVRQAHEQKASYLTIAQRCSRAGPSARAALAEQQAIFDRLHEDLSTVKHRRESRYQQDLAGLWSRTLNHVETVLALTRL